MKKLLIFLALVLLYSAALAQDTIPNHSIPIGRGPGVVGWGVVGPCAMGQVLTFQGSSSDPTCGAGGGGGGTGSLGWVVATAAPCNATGDGTTDDTAAIQCAIDAAYAAKIQTIYLPKAAVCYKTTSSLFLDPPGNLRSSLSSPTLQSFSMILTGEPGQANAEPSWGTKICPVATVTTALWVGPGQGMKVAHLAIIPPGGLQAAKYRCGQAASTGIAISGIGTRAAVEDVWINGYYYGITVGTNNGNLADSNAFHRIVINNACLGIWFASSQNFVNTCDACTISATTAIDTSQGVGITITGGNYAANSGKSAGVMTLTSPVVTSSGSGSTTTYTINATLSAPAFNGGTAYVYGDVVSSGGQVWWCINFSPVCQGTTPSVSVPSSWEPIANYLPILTAWSLVTQHYGVIPMKQTAFTQSTSAITFNILLNWSAPAFSGQNGISAGDLQAEVAGATFLAASELVTTFYGAGINAIGVHIENAPVPTVLYHSTTFLAGATADVFTDNRINFNPAQAGSGNLSGTPAQKAAYYVAQSWPHVWLEGPPIVIHGGSLGVFGDPSSPLIVDINSSLTGGNAFKIDSDSQFYSPMVVRYYGNVGFVEGGQYIGIGGAGFGAGEFEVSPFTATVTGNPGSNADGPSWHLNWGRSPHWGTRPAPIYHPCLTPGQFTVLSGALPAWTRGGVNLYTFGYPFVYGGQLYAICDWYVGVQTHYLVESTHHFYSMGQNITTTNNPTLSWNYKGQGTWVYADAQTLALLFPGLGVILNDGSSDIQYMVTGVFPALGYFTVMRGDSSGGGVLSGSKTAIITGTLIKQEPYSWVFP